MIFVTTKIVCGLCGTNIKMIQMMYLYMVLVLFGPKRKPDSDKYILWTDSVNLTDPSCYLHGPFNYNSHSDVIKTNQHVALTHWEDLFTICNTLGIVSPVLFTLTDMKPSTKKRKSRH